MDGVTSKWYWVTYTRGRDVVYQNGLPTPGGEIRAGEAGEALTFTRDTREQGKNQNDGFSRASLPLT